MHERANNRYIGRVRIWPPLTLYAMCAICAAPLSSFGAEAGPVPSVVVDLCRASLGARARCSVLTANNGAGQSRFANNLPAGFGPADLQSAYNLDTGRGVGQTVAIIGAYDAVHAESDLATYRSTFGLPACTSDSGCFTKLNQNGQASPLPGSAPSNDDWDTEYALQLDMVSAACPNCKILLIEADDDQDDGLYIAVNTAAAQPGVVAMDLPYGSPEYSTETDDEQTYFNHPGVAMVVAGGDQGFGVTFPASSKYVVSVGGTTLKTAANARGWTETAWSGTGSGCSKYIGKPAFQSDLGCSTRTTNDVAIVGDPNTGVASYCQKDGGWLLIGGTTVGSGLVAGIFALAGPPTFDGWPASTLYRQKAELYDVTSGSNGSCGGTYLCTAVTGYDGPTGNGTPNGYAAFVDDTIFADGFEN
jgi:subtilase family serine protease